VARAFLTASTTGWASGFGWSLPPNESKSIRVVCVLEIPASDVHRLAQSFSWKHVPPFADSKNVHAAHDRLANEVVAQIVWPKLRDASFPACRVK
jgi:hypothetical protein